MTKTARHAEGPGGEGPPSKGARTLLALPVVLVFVGVLWSVGFFGWFVAGSVLGEHPDLPSRVFAAGIALFAAGGILVAASSLVLVLHRLEVPGGGSSWYVRAARGSWTAGAFCALAGLLVLVGLGVTMVLRSELAPYGKAFATAVFALCALVPLAPGYEIWRRHAPAQAD